MLFTPPPPPHTHTHNNDDDDDSGGGSDDSDDDDNAELKAGPGGTDRLSGIGNQRALRPRNPSL